MRSVWCMGVLHSDGFDLVFLKLSMAPNLI